MGGGMIKAVMMSITMLFEDITSETLSVGGG